MTIEEQVTALVESAQQRTLISETKVMEGHTLWSSSQVTRAER